jgi:hypothetical protein
MKKRTGRNFSTEFKARLALEAARKANTINEIAAERERARLERKIGQLTMEVEWQAKKSNEMGLWSNARP